MERLDKKELESIDIHSLNDIMSISLWVLEYLSTDLTCKYGASDIANFMVKNLGISTSRQAVHASLTKASSKKFCHKDKKGFIIMKLGQDELLGQMRKEKVILIEPGKPFTAGMKIETILASMVGCLKVSDPYIDIKTLDVLHRGINKNLSIELLTANIKNENNFRREFLKLRYENYDINVRKVSSGDLHDRYFMDDNHFWLSGNSLNNIGKKESFIVALDGDIRSSMIKTFNLRWQNAEVI